jgi:heat shock protein HspQ
MKDEENKAESPENLQTNNRIKNKIIYYHLRTREEETEFIARLIISGKK